MAKPEAPELSTKQIALLLMALRAWAEHHPAPDDPVLSFVGAGVLTPRQLASEVAERTANGRAIIRMVQFGLEVMPFEAIIERFGAASKAV